MIKLDSEQLALVKKILKEQIPEFEVRAFGSRVSGKQIKPFSDLDLAVMSEEPMKISQRAVLNEAFSESNLTIKVDVVDWSEISENFRAQILSACEIIQPKS